MASLSLASSLGLGIVQGLTEFLPVSSSGHLVLFQRWLGLSELPLTFDIILHLGTLVALLYYFRQDWRRLSVQYGWQVIIATFPTVVFGLLLKPYMTTLNASPTMLGFQFLISAFFMFVSHLLLVGESRSWWTRTLAFVRYEAKNITTPTALQSFLVGIFQSLALLPAISRSGATLFAGLITGLNRKSAFDFAFIISVPAIAGAVILDLLDVVKNGSLLSLPWDLYILGSVAAGISGFFALKFLEYTMSKAHLVWFAWYCVFVSILSVLFV